MRRAQVGLGLLLALVPLAARAGTVPEVALALERLAAASGGTARISLHPATGTARFVRVGPGHLDLQGSSPAERAADFLVRHGRAFGLSDPAQELSAPRSWTDAYGMTHISYEQVYRGVPVFAGVVRCHFDAQGRLAAANGTFVPGVAVDPRPALGAAAAQSAAVAAVEQDREFAPAGPLEARTARLLVFRAGWVRRAPGADHLVFEVEVTDGVAVRELVYVDAHTARVVDRIQGIETLLHRTIHQGTLLDVIWDEGDALPYTTGHAANDVQVNGLITHAKDVYDLYANLSGGSFLSWDGASATMHSVWKPTFVGCPNASWNGTSTNFCDGVASDDVVAHEWTHAYTERTHGLIYQWQPGALNESYSDIFGEVVDLIDGAGTDVPGSTRTVGDCSTHGGSPPPGLTIHAPAAIAGSYAVSGAQFNPPPPRSVTADVEQAHDGDAGGGTSFTDACQALVGFTAGRIALVDRGNCPFSSKVTNAQSAGASGVIVRNTDNGGTFTMTGTAPGITIPAVMVGKTDGDLILAQLPGVNATITLSAATADSLRWLVAEDCAGFGGPIRDMWNPSCFDDPSQVADPRYTCGTGDNGGVHTNSGVPNHAFALLVDGGTFNGHTVAPLGLTKAASLYWRAMRAYQVPDTDFADHADALAQSCADLVGLNLPSLTTGAPSGQVLGAADCQAVAAAALAVGLAAEPPCDFAPLLTPNAPPANCGVIAFSDDFESDPTASWSRSNSGVYAEYVPRNWQWTAAVPAGGSGSAFYAQDSPDVGNCVAGDDDQSGVMSLASPPILLPGEVVLTFDHYVATEPSFDGGNLKISVNGGAYFSISPASFTFNGYNAPLATSASGNTNPLAGQQAFTGADGGSVHGSWGQSQVDLSHFSNPGDTIRLRFDLGVDGCNGIDGWYLDNVRVCTLASAAGRVPDGDSVPGPPLTLAKAAGATIALSWGPSCLASDVDYEVYEGTLGSFASHAPRFCSTGGATSRTLEPAPGSAYYLIVPRNAAREGSYGTDSTDAERPAGASPCLEQLIASSCPP